MPAFDPAQLARWTGGHWTRMPASAPGGFCVDSRKIRPGEIFVAIKTNQRDGHDFLGAAEAAGAAGALVAKANPAVSLPQLVVPDPLTAFQAIAREHRRNFRAPVVGISGSAGKTSTKDLVALLLGGAAGGVLATAGNLNNHLGVPLTLTRLDPDRHAFAVIEAGISAPGEMKPLAEMIEPDVSLITLVGPAHTEALGGLDGVAREKAVLPAATRGSGLAIFGRSTAVYAPFRDLQVRSRVVERADVIRPTEPPKDKVYFTITHRGAETAIALAYGPPPPLTFTLRRVSEGMAQNAVLAICTALWLGVQRESIQTRLAGWQPAAWRGEIRHEEGRMLYLDCYNANPASMLDALEAFTGIAPADEPRLYVLGGMEELGVDAAAQHRALGRALKLQSNDRVLVIGPHAAEVCAGVLDQGDFSSQLQILSSLDPAIAAVAEWRGAIFVKGSRRYQLEKVVGMTAAHA
jgi:UDP-N-acetylmuramoyl-tripeptide--D-alanyl-D-alanine ligase